MASVLMPLLEEKLPITTKVLFPKLDGRFPHRDSDPTLGKNQKQLKHTLTKQAFDFGISFDGDGDRIAFLDEKGNFINSAVIGALVAERLLQKHPRAKIGYTMLTSRSYEEAIKSAGGTPVMMRVGHAFIKDTMRKKDVLFACEHSSHFYFKDFFYTDSVTLTLLEVLDAYAEAKAEGKTFGQMMKPYIKYKQTEDVVINVKDKKLALEKTEAYIKTMQPKTLKKFDGLVVDFGDTWGGVKVSVTEFALKVMFESTTKKQATETRDAIVRYIRSIADATK
jgi:phosphomannomutase